MLCAGHHRGVNTPVSPSTIAPPAANYSHAVLAVGHERLLHTSGVVPIAPDGSVPEGLAQQAEVVWQNLDAILSEAGMATTDVVSMTTYVVQGQELGPVMAVRDRVMEGHRAASTLVVLPALARPEWLVEIALVAAR
jgi:enamine deaminase RidA (YjgF/YER057c/UK114 family)